MTFKKMIHKTKVVTRNIILDQIAKLQNVLGLNLKSYEKMIDKAICCIQKELQDEKIELLWYRFEITQLINGAVSVTLYGDEKK